ncbi:mirror-image polydactyly gene 1 protein isoform X3 [Erinaceus europaeus]|uniref:Mirror-image polydactyly gene 1 protein isoform X3 n=1 Tax=Erinaceus europaeus TaxID=9365 RepID=A0ABM3W4C2_ERIEU|nr:mirror-image polydactyly gene 1 protein isoform X3 [Erinaceus europaeus]
MEGWSKVMERDKGGRRDTSSIAPTTVFPFRFSGFSFTNLTWKSCIVDIQSKLSKTYINDEQENTERNQSTQSDEPLSVISKGIVHLKPNVLATETKYEDSELPEQSSGYLKVIGPCLSEESTDYTTEKPSPMEHRDNDLHSKCLVPCQVTSDLNKEKTVARLMKELDILRASNKKLQEKLTKEDKEKRKLKLRLELQEKAAEFQIAEKTTALVEEVYFAQRERDEAIMSRMRLANEERDEAVERVKLMEMSLNMLENINPEENDMTLQELLNRINNADTGIAIQKNGDIIVDRIYKTKECEKRITAEEMNAVIEERDAALSRAKLLAMQQAREAAVQEYKKLEEELQTLRVYYSLHKSLSQEENLKDQFNHTLSTYEEALRNRESMVSITQQQNEELASQLQQALTDRANMELELQRAVRASQATTDKVQKLERLVDVLRKKVGTGTMRTVI